MKPCARCKETPRLNETRPYCTSCERAYNRERYLRKKGYLISLDNAYPNPKPKPKRTKELTEAESSDRLFYTLFASAIRENRGLNKKTRQKTVRRALELEQYRPDIERSAELAM